MAFCGGRVCVSSWGGPGGCRAVSGVCWVLGGGGGGSVAGVSVLRGCMGMSPY